MKKASFNIRYDEATIVVHTITYYTSGPMFRFIKKSLSHKKQTILDSFCDRIRSYKDKTRERYPELSAVLYEHSEAWKLPVAIKMTTIELDLTIRAFEETLEESKIDNFYEIAVVTGFPIADIIRCLEHLQNFRTQIAKSPRLKCTKR